MLYLLEECLRGDHVADQVAEELVKARPAHADLVALPTPVVAVTGRAALREAAGEAGAAGAAEAEAAKWELWSVDALGARLTVALVEDSLGPGKGGVVDEGLEVALEVDAPLGDDDAAPIDRVAQKLGPGLAADGAAAGGAEALVVGPSEEVRWGVGARGEALEDTAHDGAGLGAGRDRLDLALLDVLVAEGGEPDPAAVLGGKAHTGLGTGGALAVVVLPEADAEGLKKLALGRVVECLGGRPDRDPPGGQLVLEGVVVRNLAGEAIDAVDDNARDLCLVLEAVVQEAPQLRAIGRLGALGLVDEHLPHLEPLALSPGETSLPLRRDGHVVHLVARGDAEVEDGEHWSCQAALRSDLLSSR
ncbi:MAG: hypothetical protein AAF604_04845 [Acidobacteriota bacterium]